MTNQQKLIIFTRYPEPGTTKTRLISALGPEGAAELHRRMVERVVGTACKFSASNGIAVEIRFTGSDESRMRRWLGDDMALAVQNGQDLGRRMDNAFKAGFDLGYNRIVLVGSDCPELTADLIEKAFQFLDHYPVVLGPAVDGGYYLVGLNKRFSRIFQDIPWGTGSVLKSTLDILSAHDISFSLLTRLHDVDTPADIPVWESAQKARSVQNKVISIIIPTLNESSRILTAIQSARNGAAAEVIVADGGSSDDTLQVASSAGATVVCGPRGRALQMNAGAEISRCSHLLFLHADTRLPQGYSNHVSSILNESDAAAGAFRFGIVQPFPGRRLVEWMTNFRSLHLQMPYGDQAIFLRRRDFIEIGGFKPLPILEDYDFIQRLRSNGRIVIADATAMTSGRRWIKLGAVRTTLINQLVIAGYYCGVPPEKLAGLYGSSYAGLPGE